MNYLEYFGDSMTDEKLSRTHRVFEEWGPVVKMNTLRKNKLFSRDVTELISVGLIRKIKTGYYIWAIDENDIGDLELACSVIPKGVICLQSAAQYHDLSTLNPTVVTIAIPSGSMRPILPVHPPIELIMAPPAKSKSR